MKSNRVLFIILIVMAGFLGLIVWFAGQVSAVYDPIKIYQLSLTRDEIHDQLVVIDNSTTTLKITFTDIIGTEETGIDYHCDVTVNQGANEYYYHLIYKKAEDQEDKLTKSVIELISAIDYQLQINIRESEDKGAKELIDLFEKEIIKKLSENTSS